MSHICAQKKVLPTGPGSGRSGTARRRGAVRGGAPLAAARATAWGAMYPASARSPPKLEVRGPTICSLPFRLPVLRRLQRPCLLRRAPAVMSSHGDHADRLPGFGMRPGVLLACLGGRSLMAGSCVCLPRLVCVPVSCRVPVGAAGYSTAFVDPYGNRRGANGAPGTMDPAEGRSPVAIAALLYHPKSLGPCARFPSLQDA